MELTQTQQAAIDKVVDWHSKCPRPEDDAMISWDEIDDGARGWGDTPQIFRLFGYAGTGKTTIAKDLAARVPGAVLFAAYTGKAASVLDRKGCRPSHTIHQLIYTPLEKSLMHLEQLKAEQASVPNGSKEYMKLQRMIALEEDNCKSPMFTLNLGSEIRNASLVVIDECSMVGEEMAKDLLQFGRPILVLGDPAQLPPVKDKGYFINAEPDVMLTEIHRQAAENPIIQLATEIRKGGKIKTAEDRGRVRIVERDRIARRHKKIGLPRSLVEEADQIICGTNATRQLVNKTVRKILGFDTALPSAGERLICLQNNHDLGILNGHIFTTLGEAKKRADSRFYEVEVQMEDSSDKVMTLKVYDGDPTKLEAIRMARSRGWALMDWGYCVTCHKSQGSEWDKVLLIDESGVFRQEASKWLYTAVTRAAEELVVAI